jgi:uncharacterized protein (DUF1499 family)
MGRRLLTILGTVIGLGVVALAVAASIWPAINEVETGATPEYPNLQPHYYTAAPRKILTEAEASIESMPRWNVISVEPANRTLEATHATRIFGFIDDVTVWAEPVTQGVTRVRVRSASRLGSMDFGQNARNVREFLASLDRRLADAKFDPDQMDKETSASDKESSNGR